MTTDKADLFAHYLALIGRDIPEPAREVKFVPGRKFRADFLWAGKSGGLIVEVDGGQWAPRGGRHNTDADREKGNLAASLGYLVLHVSPQMLERDPVSVLDAVRGALRQIGY